MIVALLAGLTRLGMPWCLMTTGGKIVIAQSASACGTEGVGLAVLGKIHYHHSFFANGNPGLRPLAFFKRGIVCLILSTVEINHHGRLTFRRVNYFRLRVFRFRVRIR